MSEKNAIVEKLLAEAEEAGVLHLPENSIMRRMYDTIAALTHDSEHQPKETP